MRLRITHDDSRFKTDQIQNGRVIKKFCKQLASNVFHKSFSFHEAKQSIIGDAEGEIPLIHLERNLYSNFAAAVDSITPVHLSEWSFNKKDNEALTSGRRVDFWCLDKSSHSGKPINYFIEIKKGYYCLNSAGSGALPKKVVSGIRSLLKQTSSIRRLSPNWGDADDVYLGIVVIHGYYRTNKVQYDHNDLRREIYDSLDGRHFSQVLVSTWELPSSLADEKPWNGENKCKFISLAMIVSTKKLSKPSSSRH